MPKTHWKSSNPPAGWVFGRTSTPRAHRIFNPIAILPWVLAVSEKLKIGALANLVVPYPTRGEAGKRAAGSFYTPTLFAPRTRRLVRLLARFG